MAQPDPGPWPLTSGPLPPVQVRAGGVRGRSGAIFSVLEGYRPLRLDLHLPPDQGGPFPLVVWIHGGAFMLGDRTALPPILARAEIFQRLPLAGLAVASIEYRLSSEAVFPAQVEDVQAAIRWLRARSWDIGIDPARMAVWGESAGGFLAAWAGVAGRPEPAGSAVAYGDQPTHVVAVVDWYGPTDFTRMDEQAPVDGGPPHDAPDSPESRLIGATVPEAPELCAAADPALAATSSAPPFLIMHGTRDRLVPFGQSEWLAGRLDSLGVEVELRTVEGADHVFDGYDRPDELVDAAVEFVARKLRSVD